MDKILVVEHEESTRELYLFVLSEAGYEPVACSSPREALSSLGVNPKAVVTDQTFPNDIGLP